MKHTFVVNTQLMPSTTGRHIASWVKRATMHDWEWKGGERQAEGGRDEGLGNASNHEQVWAAIESQMCIECERVTATIGVCILEFKDLLHLPHCSVLAP